MTIDHTNLFRGVFYSFIGGVSSAILVSYVLGYRIEDWITLNIVVMGFIIITTMFLSALLFEKVLSHFEKKL